MTEGVDAVTRDDPEPRIGEDLLVEDAVVIGIGMPETVLPGAVVETKLIADPVEPRVLVSMYEEDRCSWVLPVRSELVGVTPGRAPVVNDADADSPEDQGI